MILAWASTYCLRSAACPWLVDEEAQLRGIPFSEVIVDVTGKKVLAFDPKDEVDQRVRKVISAACDEATKRLNVHGQSWSRPVL